MDNPTLPNISVNHYKCFFLIFCNSILILIMGYLLIHKGYSVYQLPTGDDQLFLSFFHRIHSHPISGLVEVLHERYLGWSGRLTIEAIMISSIGYPIFWRTAIPLSLLLLSISTSRITCGKISIIYSFIALILLLTLPDYLNFDAAWWIPGFYNYLFPTSFLIYTLSVILNHNQSNLEFIFCIFSVMIFAYMEQAGLVFLSLLFFCFIFIKSFRQSKNYILYGLCLINFAILMLAPGNHTRYLIAAWGWFPEYFYYPPVPKLYYGLEKFHQAMILDWNYPILLMMICLGYLYIKQGIKTIAGYTSLMVIIFFTICILLKWTGHDLSLFGFGKSFFSEKAMGAYKSDLVSTYTSYFLILMTVFSLITLILSSIKPTQRLCIILFIFIVGIGSLISVGLSPTIYISTLRVDYMFEICVVLVCMMSFHEAIHPYTIRKTSINKTFSQD